MSTSFKIMEGNGNLCSRPRLILVWAIVATIIGFCLMIALIVRNSERLPPPKSRAVINWCTTSSEEQEKCQQFSRAMNESSSLDTLLKCDLGADADDCVARVKDGRSHAVNLDGGKIAANRDAVTPIVAEDYGEGPANYWAVAVAKTSTLATVNLTLEGMRDKKSCHTGYEKTAGWYFPIGTLMRKGIITPPAGGDCDPLSLAKDLFQSMCVPASGDADACSLCSEGGTDCSCDAIGDYCGYTGAFRCLLDYGDVAFVKHTTVLANTDGNNDAAWAAGLKSSDFQLLCPDGTRAPVTAYAECSLGRAPSHAVVIANNAAADLTPRIQEFLEVAELRFGYGVSDGDGDADDDFQLFGGDTRDLLFKSSTKRLLPLTDNCETDTFLGEEYLNVLSFVDNCAEGEVSVGSGECLLAQYREENYEKLRWCVVSDAEMAKCQAVEASISSQEIKTDLQLTCIRAVTDSAEECAQLISENDADVASMDGGHIFSYSRRYNLQPLAAELYDTDGSTSPGASYYAVAVVHKNDSNPIDFRDLQNLKTCHTGYGKTAGWVVPIGTLVSKGQIHINQTTCDVVEKVAEYFNGSCAPTVPEPVGNLCSLCKDDNCNKSSSYYGYSGAFRCLSEGGGDVAFIKHTTVAANAADPSLYKLLCKDGTQADVANYKDCNLAKVPAHALMTAPRNTAVYREKVWSLLDKLQKSDFNLFESDSYGGEDLLFKDSTRCIGKVDQTCKWQDFLGEDYVNANRGLQCIRNPPTHTYQACQISSSSC